MQAQRRGPVALCLLLAFQLAAAQPATLAVVNARIWTGNLNQPSATALAAAADRILVVGSDAQVAAACNSTTRVIDANGAIVTPGLIDAHIHLMSYDRNRPLQPIFLRFLKGRQSVAEKIATYTAALPKGAWILGDDWTDSTWRGPLPSRLWLDSLAPHHPVWLVAHEGNVGIASTAALRAAGFPSAHQTGVIRGGPMWRIEAAIVSKTREQDEQRLEQVMTALLRVGITSVHHNNSWYDFLVLRRLHQAAKLRIRVYASPPLPAWERLRDYVAVYGRGDSWMHWGALKGFGAVRAEDYDRWAPAASQAGLQIMVHLGSEAELRTLLDVFGRVRRDQNLPDPRFRLEHAHDLPPDVIPLMAKVGAIASWQPPLLAHFQKPTNLFPVGALLKAGVKIAFGTDTYPASHIVAPRVAIQMALDRTAPDGSRMTLDQALRAFTIDAAYAEFAERDKGSLEPGKVADFVLFDREFSTVRMTVVAGIPRYESN